MRKQEIKIKKNIVIINSIVYDKKELNEIIRSIILNEIDEKLEIVDDEFEFLSEMREYIKDKEDLFENCEIEDDAIYIDTDGNEFGAFGENSFIYEIEDNQLKLFCGGDIIELKSNLIAYGIDKYTNNNPTL